MAPTQAAVRTLPATKIINGQNGGATLNGQIHFPNSPGGNVKYWYKYYLDPTLQTGVKTTANATLIATGDIDQTNPTPVTGLAPGTYYYELYAIDPATDTVRPGGIVPFVISTTDFPTRIPTVSPSLCPQAAGANFYFTNCGSVIGCVFIKDANLRASDADCAASCTAGYSGSTCYGCLYDPTTQGCVLLVSEPYNPPCTPQ